MLYSYTLNAMNVGSMNIENQLNARFAGTQLDLQLVGVNNISCKDTLFEGFIERDAN